MVFDVTLVIVLGHHESCPDNTANLTDKCLCSDCSSEQFFPHLSPLPWATYSLRHNTEMRPADNLTMASKFSSERKSHKSPTLNLRLEMLKFSEEGMLKARPLVPVFQVVNTQEKFLKEI